MSLTLEMTDSDGDLIEVEADAGTDEITVAVYCEELAEDTDYEAVVVELHRAEAKRLAFNLLTAVGYLDAADEL